MDALRQTQMTLLRDARRARGERSMEVIEDEPALRELLKTRLVDSGFNVDTAADGEEGLFLALENPLDVSIVDLGLPKLPGLELIRRVRAAAQSSPTLVLTPRARWRAKGEGRRAAAGAPPEDRRDPGGQL